MFFIIFYRILHGFRRTSRPRCSARHGAGSTPGVSALRHPPSAAGVEDAERWKGVFEGGEWGKYPQNGWFIMENP